MYKASFWEFWGDQRLSWKEEVNEAITGNIMLSYQTLEFFYVYHLIVGAQTHIIFKLVFMKVYWKKWCNEFTWCKCALFTLKSPISLKINAKKQTEKTTFCLFNLFYSSINDAHFQFIPFFTVYANNRLVCRTIYHLKHTSHWNLHWSEMFSISCFAEYLHE